MGIASIYFTPGDLIRLHETEYKIIGSLYIRDEKKDKEWIEYYLDDTQSIKTMWLKVDNTYEDYLLYSSPLPLNEERKRLLVKYCYYKIDEGSACIIKKEGDMYSEVNSYYEYEMYKSSIEEGLKQIQRWTIQEEIVDCIPIDPKDIVRIDMQEVSVFAGTYDNTYTRKKHNLSPEQDTPFQRDERKMHLIVGVIIGVLWLLYELL